MNSRRPFVKYLEGLREDRAALAALRRGLGHPPGTVPDTYRYVAPWLSADAPPWVEDAHFVIASLFAYHPQPGGMGNMGHHFARARDPRGDETAIERRFTALLAAHPEDLDSYLRHAVGFLRSREVALNWDQLLGDIIAWGHPDRYVQKAWARAFWARPTHEVSADEEA